MDISPALQEFVALIFKMGLELLIPVLVASLLVYVTRGYQWLSLKLGADRLNLLENLVRFAVRSAEQAGLTEQIENSAEAKKQLAIELVQKGLRSRGLGVLADNVEEISYLIEALINQQVHKFEPPWVASSAVEPEYMYLCDDSCNCDQVE